MRTLDRVFTTGGWVLLALGFAGSLTTFGAYTVETMNGPGVEHAGEIRMVAVMVALVIVLGVWLLWAGARRAGDPVAAAERSASD